MLVRSEKDAPPSQSSFLHEKEEEKNRDINSTEEYEYDAGSTSIYPAPLSWLDSPDLRPLPASQATWGLWTYSFFWTSASANLSNWYSPNSFMTFGLTLWEALACHIGGQILAGIFMTFTGRPGAVYKIGFPVLCRSSFGMLGAIWPVVNRLVMSILWNGVNLVQGAQCIYVMLHCIFPGIANLKNVMAPTDAINSGGLIGMFIFWILIFLCCLIPVPRLKYWLHFKLVIFFVSAIVMLGWTLSLSKGLHSVATAEKPLDSSTKSWLLTKFILLSLGNCSTLIANAADFQRYCTKANDVLVGQIIGFPLGNFVISLVGLIVAMTSKTLFGEVYWNPVEYLDALLSAEYSSSRRAGVFFLASMFAYSGLISCILENLLPAANDMAGLWPRYITIRRAFFICNALSICCAPWKLLGSASSFLKWLSSYQIFLSAVIGIILSDYFVIRRRQLDTKRDLYLASSESQYWYCKGINGVAFFVYIITVASNFYGFLGAFDVVITIAGERYYYFAFLTGTAYSFIFYSLLTLWLNH